ncbi:MAG: hypothetical protein GX616_02255 [Planctomycetes bacterium]|nr:hypothetical protein [Planctomycetota bacterium]
MAVKIKIRRGPKASLPTLDVGEPGFCPDTGEFFIGTESGNVAPMGQQGLPGEQGPQGGPGPTGPAGPAGESPTAANIGAVIAGAEAKTTPADADSVGLSDSAASGALKKLTWTNIKAALKSYFDGLYNNYTLPAASASALGGIKVGANLNIDGSGVLSASPSSPAGVGGASTFNGYTTGRVITHNLGNTNYHVSITPTADTSGMLGEVWVTKSADTCTVKNSGSSAAAFTYHIIPY